MVVTEDTSDSQHHLQLKGEEGNTDHHTMHLKGRPQLWDVVDEDRIDISEDADGLYHRIMELSENIQHKLEESDSSYKKPVKNSCVDEGRIEGGGWESKVSVSMMPDGVTRTHTILHPSSSDTRDSITPSSEYDVDTRGLTTSSCSSHWSEKSDVHFDDAKTQKAYERMLKLDEKLAGVCKRERDVKRQRRLLEEEMERVGAGQPSNVMVSAGEAIISSLIQSPYPQ
jgi:hypothetical protein